MTTEEKAKAYDEALERARKELEQDLHESGVRAIQRIFPELRESEDERIRKEIIEFISWAESRGSVRSDWHQKKCPGNWIAYLEKQKEQKHPNGCFTCDEYKKGYEEGRRNGFTAGYNKAIKEQKPVECLKAERDGWYVCIKDYYRGGKKQSSVGDLVQAKGGMFMMGEEDISEWFRRAYYEEVRDAFEPNADTNIPEQKHAEKQDYSGLNDLERAIHRGFLCAGVENVPVEIIKETAQECLARMKPAEWSEEDKRKLNRIYEILGYAADDKGFLTSKRIIGDKEAIELQDFLKSLHPDSYKNCNSRLSEEDNIGWDEAFACVTRAEKAAKNEEELQNAVTAEKWLMEIKFKYYVHPVKQEWSEEDEEAYKFVIALINSLIWRKDWVISKAKCLKMLKSLRPSWKPSEEQMKALYCALCEEISRTHFDALESLYNDLKKLM